MHRFRNYNVQVNFLICGPKAADDFQYFEDSVPSRCQADGTLGSGAELTVNSSTNTRRHIID